MDWARFIDKLESKTGKSIYKEVGCRSQFISDLKSGKSKNPGADFVLKLIEKFNLNTNYLLTGEGEMFTSEVEQRPAEATVRVPILAQKISCGSGQNWETEQNVIEYVNFDSLALKAAGHKIYGVRAAGSSMLGVGIEDGDIVLFLANPDIPQCCDGNYVFGLDGDVYCKRLEFDSLAKTIKVFSVRGSIKTAELIRTLNMDDFDLSERFCLFGKVFAWIHQDK